MSENLQKLLKEAFLNNSFDYDSMDKSLNHTWINSYSYLYTLQKSHVQYEELFFYSNDEESRNSKHVGHLYLDKRLYANFDVDYDLIDVCNREEYRRSELYYKPYSFEEMTQRKTIFTKIPLVMIDDKVIFDYQMISKNDNTTFILPFKRSFVIDDKRKSSDDDITYIDHKIQVLVIDNKYYERIRVNKNTINFSAITKTFEIDKSLLSGKYPSKNNLGTMFCSIHVPNNAGKNYELGTMMIPLEYGDDKFTASLTNDLNILLHQTTKEFYISVFYINRLTEHEFYFGGNEVTTDENGKTSLMVVQRDELVPYEMPIPVEDFMIFKKSVDEPGYKLVKNTEMLNMYYPNIYTFKDKENKVGDKYKVYYFYYNGDNYKYTVLFDFYYRFLKDAFLGYKFEAIIDGIYNDKFDYDDFTYFSADNQRRIVKFIAVVTEPHGADPINYSGRVLLENGQIVKFFDVSVLDENGDRIYFRTDPGPEILGTDIIVTEDGSIYNFGETTIVPVGYSDEEIAELKEKYRCYPVYNDGKARYPVSNEQIDYFDQFRRVTDYVSRVLLSDGTSVNFTDTSVMTDGPEIVELEDGSTLQFEILSVSQESDFPDNDEAVKEYAVAKFKESFRKIINYQYYNHLYGETDFLHRYLMEPGNEDKAPIEYKDETMRDWIRVEPYVLRDYVREQKKLGDVYHLFTNTIDLPSRLRYDTEAEMGRRTEIFEDPRYVFALNNTRPYPVLLDCRVFVDGLLVMDLYQERKNFMDYLYIPADMVTEDSYIEIEIFPSYMYKEDMTFESLDEIKHVKLPKPDEVIFPTLADIYFTSKELPGARIGEENFDFYVKCSDRYGDRGNFLAYTEDEDKPLEFVRVTDFDIQLTNDTLMNIPLELRFTKNSIRTYVKITEPGYPYIEIPDKNWNFSTEYLRIFRNGRLIPRCKYQFNSGNGQPRIIFLDYFDAGEFITIDISPYRYHEIYYKEELSENDTLIDLRGIINKPFDIRYYDVYMNGRRLSLNNVFTISPWQITLVNLHSIYNLEIFEKERDWEYFGLDYTQNIYYYTIDDLFNSGFITEEEKNKMIKDIIDHDKDENLNIYPNTNEEERQDRTDNRKTIQLHIYYHDQLIPHEFSNPNILEENYELMSEDFFYVLETYMRRSRDGVVDIKSYQRKYNYPKVLMHDPDIIYSQGIHDKMVVYPIGHLENKLPNEYEGQVPKFINGDDLPY